jgi:hypothetical protein
MMRKNIAVLFAGEGSKCRPFPYAEDPRMGVIPNTKLLGHSLVPFLFEELSP